MKLTGLKSEKTKYGEIIFWWKKMLGLVMASDQF
jgi:hypothetical protein